MYITGLRCTLCHAVHPEPAPGAAPLYTCPACGEAGILDVEYDYAAARAALALSAPDTPRSHFRYLPVLPLPTGAVLPGPPVGWTPIIAAPGLAAELGIAALSLKDEGRQPTASFKDRASSVGAARARALGFRAVACSSTGNAASSLAGMAASLGLTAIIFVPATAPAGKVAQLRIFGAKVVLVQGTYADAFALSQQAVAAFGCYNRNAAINPYLVEGKKTCGLEIAEQLAGRLPDWLSVSVGDGCTVYALWKGLREAQALGILGPDERLPRILAVQAAGAAPLHRAFHAGTEDVPPQPAETLADSIAVGVPRNPLKALRAVRASGGTYVTVSDEEILGAMHLLARRTGVFGEPAGVAALAGVGRAAAAGIIKRHESVLHVVTGSGLKDVAAVERACPPAVRVPPDFAAVRAALEPLFEQEARGCESR